MYFDEDIKQIYQQLNSSEKGLSDSEAKERLKKYGHNELKKKPKKSLFFIFLSQFNNFLIFLLIGATILSLILGEIPDAIGMFSIVLLSGILGFVQEYRAEEAMEALKKMSAPYAKVLRDGIEQKILAKDIVPGDIILLEEGDIVPADLRLIDESSMRVEEASLTGESVPVKKNIAVLKKDSIISDQENMVFMGTTIVYGKGSGIAVSTGMRTELGKIAESIQEIKETTTPLQIKFEAMAKQIGLAVLGLVLIVFIIGLLNLKVKMAEMFLFSLSLAVAAVPSSLPAIVTVSLGIGTKTLAKKNMIIKQLPAAESLGSVTVICTDKTGTLTKNQMTITKLFVNNEIIEVSGSGYMPEGKFSIISKENSKTSAKETEIKTKEINIKDKKELELLVTTGFLCNNAELLETENKKWEIIGDPTEGSLIVLAKKANIDQEYIKERFTEIKELPFDSDRKRMSVIFQNNKNKKTSAYVKGAPDLMLKICDKILINGKEIKITKKHIDKINETNNAFASKSLRVLALAYKDVSKLKTKEINTVEKDLVFIGLVGMIDPPRDGVKEAIAQCNDAGINVIMITGDHPATAKAIGEQIGLLKGNDIILTGAELDKISDEELAEKIDDIRIIARAMPIQKTRIVSALQKKGHIVAMTGDGVNDAPALKKADIGIAMGITGTDVSKEVAKAVLADDNFTTIVNAIAEGRTMYDKIIKSTKYLLSCNMGEIVAIFIAIVAKLPLPMLPLQILMMNLLTDGLPALGLGSETAEEDVMQRPPRNPKEHPITKQMLYLIIIFGIVMGLGTIFVFNLYLHKELALAQTMAFTTLVMFEMFAVMSARSFMPIFNLKHHTMPNKWLILSVIASILLQIAVIYLAPLQKVFGTVALSLGDWGILLAVSCLGFIVMELSKIFIKEKFNNVHNHTIKVNA